MIPFLDRCTAPRCLSRAENSQQRRCAVHTVVCSVEGCDRPCHLHRDGHLDLACAVHYGSFQCAWAGCTRRRPGYDVKYCLAHKCAALPGCANGRDPAGGHVCVARKYLLTYIAPSCFFILVQSSQSPLTR